MFIENGAQHDLPDPGKVVSDAKGSIAAIGDPGTLS